LTTERKWNLRSACGTLCFCGLNTRVIQLYERSIGFMSPKYWSKLLLKPAERQATNPGPTQFPDAGFLSSIHF
jgi:hypothetical protein